MTDKTFTLTIDQIKEIYNAGIRRGEETECAYQHGSRTMGGTFDQCVDALYDIVNEGKSFNDDDHVGYGVVESWFK